MTKQEAIQILKRLAPKGATIISTVKGRFDQDPTHEHEDEVDVGGRVISFDAAFVKEGKLEMFNINGSASIAMELERYEVRGTGEGIYLGGVGANFALMFIYELGKLVWNDEQTYKHYEA